MQVVPAFDPLEDCDSGFGLRLEPTPIEQLFLECGEEAFGHGVVVGITDRALLCSPPDERMTGGVNLLAPGFRFA